MPATYGQTTISTAKVIEHALRRAGVQPEDQTPDVIDVARDNLFFLFSSFTTRGLPLWCVEEISINIVSGTKRYTCPDGTMDVLQVNMRQNGVDRILTRVSRDQYFVLPDKNTSGNPVQYWYDKQLTPQIVLWPVPNFSAATLQVVRKRAIADVGGLTEELLIPTMWIENTIWQLAARLVMSLPKIDPATKEQVLLLAKENRIEVEADDVDGAPVNIAPDISVYS